MKVGIIAELLYWCYYFFDVSFLWCTNFTHLKENDGRYG